MRRSSCASLDLWFLDSTWTSRFKKRSVDLTLPGRKNVQWLNQIWIHSLLLSTQSPFFDFRSWQRAHGWIKLRLVYRITPDLGSDKYSQVIDTLWILRLTVKKGYIFHSLTLFVKIHLFLSLNSELFRLKKKNHLRSESGLRGTCWAACSRIW